ncbi:hypothetical protein N7463_009045 [Penicillium fimorum]|uniref:Ribosomal RNA methyltransferase FtsJ domain-containing protein n=1 Tax=Penicillium fimorum TaxID=1882269 RepID=A0A9W9XQ12_9EURO|nr:hypothetical protein N7463_009045 [Penicillium fimorum]
MAAVDSGQGQVEASTLLPDSQLDNPQSIEEPTEEPAENSRSVVPYLLETSPEFRELSDVRQRGWETPEDDKYLANMRRNADKSDEKTSVDFHKLMNTLGQEIDTATNAFKIRQVDSTPPAILDICMAPGAFLEIALRKNRGSHALAFSLPVSCGGYRSRLASGLNAKRVFLDVTMLAADMDVDRIPEGHEDAENFCPGNLKKVGFLIWSYVLRQHTHAPYQEGREAKRLATAQLALGLQHLTPSGTIVVFLHRLEAWNIVNLIRTFHKISSVRLFKPTTVHAKRQHPEAIEAVKRWKIIWRVATFASDEEYRKVILDEDPSVETLLEDFGPELVKLGKEIWKIQANALADAPFMKKSE